MTWAWIPILVWVVDVIIKIVAVGTIPTNRRPSSSIAWLLFIFLVPIIGLIIFLLIGSPFVRGRRAKIQAEATEIIAQRMAGQPELPPQTEVAPGVGTLVDLNRSLTALPCVLGVTHGVIGDAAENSLVMAQAIDEAQR